MDNGMIFALLLIGACLLIMLGVGIYTYLNDKMRHRLELLRIEKGLPPAPVYVDCDCDCERE